MLVLSRDGNRIDDVLRYELRKKIAMRCKSEQWMQFFRDNLKYFRCDKIAASLPLLLQLLIYFKGKVCDLKLKNNVN